MKTTYLNINFIGVICVLTACAARVGHAQDSKGRCSLLTQAAINAVTGVSVEAGVPIDTRGCSWQSIKPHVIVTATFMGPAMAAVFTKESPGGAPRTHVSGIGDDAVYESAGSMGSLWVKHAKDILLVRVYGVSDAEKQKSIVKTLAQDVLKKL
jgi:hypothetical protein